ncbi:hydroxyacid dehydrogenase [Chimaeribacter arupi]|uniref:Hydroxyacid dehydrogenase n=3 Tax=Yersiniaceae TaxID=1903411 RepID=A0A2N5ELY2_9GAMM|nr:MULTISPECIES: NAD(P)-dependent alcohol dehydrogenase [Yersiniaceae]MBS0967351.1 NAD(P)-dependent alcohol dehydrogenase [Nissabacter archeti]PLR43751.1 hydroxyacid dehydrogenase [Chimaeribacter arupi]PLR44716.1 hydroxyacid dehydrogenase [Chimaeribacter arupi]PLR48430.1 hydroxyacid dehydrogenase [Chimaeribacter arupi]WKZ93924.1 NAD(P)-dependent alcohol dehydrogenase [Chimaeribacter arupi]
MKRSFGYAAQSAQAALAPFHFDRRDTGPDDVRIEIAFCGVCHSDLHMARNEWNMSRYPLVPGHEIVGHVTETGANVSRFKVGQRVGVGVMVGSCGQCAACHEGEEQYCDTGFTATYNGEERVTGGTTFGGYATDIVVAQDFVVRVPEQLDPAAVAPLLCAGVTTWSPLRHWNVQPGQRIGVVGLGGLGHMAVKLATAMGAEVVLFTTSPGKGEDALRLGAKQVVVSTDARQMAAQANRLDMILNCVAAPHDLNPYLATLKSNGKLILVGIPDSPHQAPDITPMVFKRLSIAGTSIGSMKETQEMLDFCGEHGITADVEVIRMDEIEQAFARMSRGDVKYRFVIDMNSLRAE